MRQNIISNMNGLKLPIKKIFKLAHKTYENLV